MEDFVTYNQAVKLKELGFDWECYAYYLYDDKLNIGRQLQKYNSEWHLINLGYISAPTLAQVQKWFREEYNIDICIMRSFAFTNPSYRYEILMNNDYEDMTQRVSMPTTSYEHALSSAINKVLEFLKENGK